MDSKTCLIFFFFFSCLIITKIALAQDRAPHGLAYESPVAFSPSAFDFFNAQPEKHDATLDPCAESACSPLPVIAAKVQGSAQRASTSSGSTSGVGGTVGIIFGLALALLM